MVVSTSKSYGPKVWMRSTSTCAALTDAPVSAGVLAPVKLVEAAVHADHEHIQIRQQNGQLVAPAAELDDVLDDVARR